MKKISKIKMLVLALLGTFVFMVANAQCDWTVFNGTDCSISLKIVQNCNGDIHETAATALANGNWSPTSRNTINTILCDPNCTYTVKISNINNPEAEFGDGDEFCCNGRDCTPNNCVTIRIDVSTKRIALVKPDRCK